MSKWERTDRSIRSLRHAIRWHRSRTWYWQNYSGQSVTRTDYAERSTRSLAFLRWINHRWQARLKDARRLAARVTTQVTSDLGAWMCIHRYEGSWTDPGSPYWGGLQMDLTFQKEYGPEFYRRWGTADHWPVWAQITAARRARDGFRSWGPRGYGPWPKAAALCGLL